MKLLINLCAHDGIVSHYAGVGTIVKRYIVVMEQILKQGQIDYHINMFTPQYNSDSFGYSYKTKQSHSIMENVSIYELPNGTNGELAYGTPDNWKLLSKNVAEVINEIDISSYDKVLTIANDTPYAGLLGMIKDNPCHYKVWIPHSTGKIHKVDSSIENSDLILGRRIIWEEEAIDYINNNENCYLGSTGNYIGKHLIEEYGLNEDKIIKITNGEILSSPTEYEVTPYYKELFSKIENQENIILSFGRAETYKNLEAPMLLGKIMGIKPVVIAQSYFEGQPIIQEYKALAQKTDTSLFVDAPFNFPQYIVNNFKNNMIMLVPSKKEIMGLTFNEIRKLNKDNVLIVANNIDGIKEQVEDGVDGLLVDLDDLKASGDKIQKYFNNEDIKNMNNKAQIRLEKDYNIGKNFGIFLEQILRGNLL